ncbi:MAG: hypothetical protein VB862_17920, partial [Pirellulaceae bacterium]
NRLVVGMVASALFLSSALLLAHQVPPPALCNRAAAGNVQDINIGTGGLLRQRLVDHPLVTRDR